MTLLSRRPERSEGSPESREIPRYARDNVGSYVIYTVHS